MPGPPPNPNARRRNAPTIAATVLPAAGRKGRPPAVPKPYKLGKHGSTWWRWAWRLPQATQWDDGALYFVLRRAVLEDELAAVGFTDELDLEDLLAGAEREAVDRVTFALDRLKRSASGATSLMKEMRELDNRLGLNPKAMSDLRWTLEEPAASVPADDGDVARLDDYRARIG